MRFVRINEAMASEKVIKTAMEAIGAKKPSYCAI
jgi:hypothetical protein